MVKYLDIKTPSEHMPPEEDKRKPYIDDDILVETKLEVRQSLDFDFQHDDSVRKKSNKIIAVLASFLLIILSSGGVYWWQKNKAEKDKKSSSINEQEDYKAKEDIWDLQKIDEKATKDSELLTGKMLLVSKENNHVTVFKKDPGNGAKETLFEFDDSQKSKTSGKKDVFAASIALSPDKKTIAFIADDGLSLYDLEKNEKDLLVKKEAIAVENMGIAPRWSVEDLKDVYALINPKWSPDGQFLSFVQIYSDYYGIGIINVRSKEYHPVQKNGGEAAIGLNAQWSLNANIIIDPEFNGGDQSGLFISSDEKFDVLDNLSEKIGEKGADFYEAAISNDNKKIALIYKDNYGEEDDNILAVSSISGSDFSVLDKKYFKTLPFFSYKGDSIFFISDLSDDSSLLSSINLETKQKSDRAILPKNFNFWFNPAWREEKQLSILGKSYDPLNKNQKIKEIFLLIDVDNKKIINKEEFEEGTGLVGFL